MMKRSPGLMLLALGMVTLHHRFAAIPPQAAGPAVIQAARSLVPGMPADDSGGDDGDDDGDSGDSE